MVYMLLSFLHVEKNGLPIIYDEWIHFNLGPLMLNLTNYVQLLLMDRDFPYCFS